MSSTITGSERAKLWVGAVLIVAAMGLVALLTVYGDRPLTRGFELFVDFDRVENLEPGAEVRYLGQPAGRVLGIRQRPASAPRSRPQLRVQIWLGREYLERVWRNAELYIDADSVIGERRLAIGPPSQPPATTARPGAVLRGIDPPRLDRFFQVSFRAMSLAHSLLREQGPRLGALVDGIRRVARRLEGAAPAGRWGRIRDSLRAGIGEVEQLLDAIDTATADGARTRRLRASLLRLMARDGGRSSRVSAQLAQVAAHTEALARQFDPATRRRITGTVHKLRDAAIGFDDAGRQLAALLARVQRGEGTLGRLMTDPELDDEIKRTHQILKESPWRVLGKPGRQGAPRGVRRRAKPR